MTELLTRAEASKYTQTSRHSDVVAFVDELCRQTKLARRVDFGQSGEGQPHGGARRERPRLLHARAGAQAEEGHRDGGGQHPRRVKSRARSRVLALARDLTLTPLGKKLLDKLLPGARSRTSTRTATTGSARTTASST